MKKIYIVLTYTGTMLSRIIRIFTRNEFCHSSISLDRELEELYSFGRLNPYNPFIGGFVHEGIHIGTFKRFKNTQAEISSIEIEDAQYEIIKNTIKEMQNCREEYKFNIIGLFAAGLKRRIYREHSFYCSEFVKYLLDTAKVSIKLPDIIKPEDFKNIENKKLVYKGKLRDYKVKKEDNK